MSGTYRRCMVAAMLAAMLAAWVLTLMAVGCRARQSPRAKAAQKPACAESVQIFACLKGSRVCTYDAKRDCEVCTCNHDAPGRAL